MKKIFKRIFVAVFALALTGCSAASGNENMAGGAIENGDVNVENNS